MRWSAVFGLNYRPLLLALLLLSGCQRPPTSEAPAGSTPAYIGSQRCAECHSQASKDWIGSHHHQAMQPPSEQTVLGDFNDTEFDHFGIKSRFYRKGEEFWVTTDGPKGVSQSYRIEYTFGVEPLQQYLIRFDDGRLQALSICWDTEKKRWFHLHPDEKIESEDALHWTGPQYNWNFMCAECHSTGVKKNYDADSDRYNTSFAEHNVSCEACHGPGSSHLEYLGGAKLPNHGFAADLKGRGPWQPQNQQRPALPASPGRQTDQLETCARCHSRRAQLKESYVHGQALGQTHALSILDDGLYHADGQIDDEVFVYGSFLQSKMYRAGVVCTDCHHPHTAQLRAQGDNLCLSCHLPSKYQTRDHSHHQGVSCVDCHMPGKLYMVNDFRRDHSFRVPRPDLSVKTGSPNACNQCHQDKSVEWAQQAYVKWYGQPPSHYGVTFHQLRQGDHSALAEAAAIARDQTLPAIVRATAVSLAPLPEVVGEALGDQDSLVRREAVKALMGAPAESRRQLLEPLASDPVAEVRLEAARLLVGTGSQQPAVQRAIEEYRASLAFNADRVESRLATLDLLAQSGQFEQAEHEIEILLERFPDELEVYVNVADYHRLRGADEKGKALLFKGLSRLKAPATAPLHHALGLLMVREKEYDKALEQFKMACTQRPDVSQYSLVYAVALDSQGQTARAVEVLQAALNRQPRNTELGQVLRSYQEKLAQPER